MSEVQIQVIDTATPFLAELAARNPRAVASALRSTAASHRKKLKYAMESNSLGMKAKKPLDARGERKVREATQVLKVRDRHIHGTLKPFHHKNGRSHLYHAVRYAVSSTKGKSADAYDFGFVGNDLVGSGKIKKGVRDAAKYMDALAKGMFLDKRTGRLSKAISPAMARYFKSIGLETKKGMLDFPKRDPIKVYFNRYKSAILADFRFKFAKALEREQKRAERRAKSRGRKVTYSSKNSRMRSSFIRSNVGA